jgi:ABC-type glycerol-3-phosphate transport system substrate-binding protein
MLAACSPAPTAPPPTPTAAPVVPPTLTPVPGPTTTPSPLVLRAWVAPAFAPDPQSEAGALLQARLEAFEAAHPNVRVEIRLKDETGPAGLLETLQAALRVAPAALPDLITLDSSDLAQAAAGAGLVELVPLLEEGDSAVFDFARQAVEIGGERFGQPFGSRADVLVFRVDSFSRAPRSWSDLLSSRPPFLFPAGDSEALTTLAEYLSLEVSLADERGELRLDPLGLEEVLAFYGSAHNAGLLPLTVRQYETSLETWGAFHEGRASSAVAPLHVFLAEGRPTTEWAAPLPTRDGGGVCLALAWSWALVTQDPERKQLAGDLMAWLTDPAFLGPWTQALGLLPVDRASLDAWLDGTDKTLAQQLVEVARPMPTIGVRSAVGAPIRSAVDSVLSGQLTPNAAALAASQALPSP